MAESDNTHREPNDEAVIANVLAGRTDDFETLVERYKQTVAAIVRGKVPHDEAPEVAHEVFIRVFESLGNYSPVKPFEHWLARLAVRTCYDFWRKRYRQREMPEAALSEEQRAWLEGYAASLREGGHAPAEQRFEAWELLDWALGRLAPADRLVVTLVHLEERSVAEAADLLGWSKAKVRVRAYRARKRLREVIEGELT